MAAADERVAQPADEVERLRVVAVDAQRPDAVPPMRSTSPGARVKVRDARSGKAL